MVAKNSDVPCFGKFCGANEGVFADVGHYVDVFCRLAWILLAGFLVPLGDSKTLWDLRPVGMNAHLFASITMPTCDVVPLSAMADGIEPLRIPLFM